MTGLTASLLYDFDAYLREAINFTAASEREQELFTNLVLAIWLKCSQVYVTLYLLFRLYVPLAVNVFFMQVS